MPILSNGMRFHKKVLADAVMITCCILHNMLLHCDGLDMSQWDKEEDWENIDPNAGGEVDDEECCKMMSWSPKSFLIMSYQQSIQP